MISQRFTANNITVSVNEWQYIALEIEATREERRPDLWDRRCDLRADTQRMVGIAKNTLSMNYDTDGRHRNHIYIALKLVLQSFR